jgi:hypothetical protein
VSGRGGSPTPERLLGIYLEDHLAVLVGGCELVRRALGETHDPELRRFLEQLLPELRADRAAAARVLRSLGREPSRLKEQLAWAGEKVGRLKLNGALVSHSPLSRLVELEGIAAVVGADRALWRALAHAGPGADREDAERRALAMDERLRRVEELRLAAADAVFSGSGRPL